MGRATLVLLGALGLVPGIPPEPPKGTYPIPKHGVLNLKVPQGWVVTSSFEEVTPSLQLRFEPREGDSFSLLVTAVWLTPEKLSGLTPDGVKGRTLQAAALPLQRSEERIVAPEELRGAETTGYYVSFTDRAPSPADYKYQTRGVSVTGDLMVVYTFLNREAPCTQRDEALQMLANATYTRAPR